MVAVAGGAVLAEGLAFLVDSASGSRRPPASLTARIGGVAFLWFHHVGLVFGSTGGEASFRLTLALALLGGTAVAVWLLALGGGAVARVAARTRRGGDVSVLRTGLEGVKVAPPYALVSLAATSAIHFSIHLPTNVIVPLDVSIHPATVGAFVWPLVIAAAAGFGGAVRAAARDGATGARDDAGTPGAAPGSRDARVRAALAGGWRMLVLGMALSFVGLLILGAVHPDATRAYFDAVFRRGSLRGVTLIAITALAAPNMAAWVLSAAMGSCLGQFGSSAVCVLSYRHFPSSGGTLGGSLGRLVSAVPGGPAPAGYLLFFAVPVVATVIGGVHAAARSRSTSRAEAAWVGAGAGLVFGALAAILVALASIAGSVGPGLGRASTTVFRLGPDPVRTALLAFAWGVIGGTLGALAHGPSPPGEAVGAAVASLEEGETPAAPP